MATSTGDPAREGSGAPSTDHSMRGEGTSGWTGWVVFGGFMLILMGSFQLVQGLVAVFNDGFYLVRSSGLVVNVNYNTWGWTHVVIGIVAVLTGLGLLAGNMLARVVGVVVAMVSALVNMAFVPPYPFWSLHAHRAGRDRDLRDHRPRPGTQGHSLTADRRVPPTPRRGAGGTRRSSRADDVSAPSSGAR